MFCYFPGTKGNNLRHSITRSTAPSLIYKVSFPLRKIKQMSVCTNKAVQAVPNITLEQNI